MSSFSSSLRSLREAAEISREEMAMHKSILAEANTAGGKTIPELAEALEYPQQEVVYWVMSMWKYGVLVESSEADEDGYFKYRPSPDQL